MGRRSIPGRIAEAHPLVFHAPTYQGQDNDMTNFEAKQVYNTDDSARETLVLLQNDYCITMVE